MRTFLTSSLPSLVTLVSLSDDFMSMISAKIYDWPYKSDIYHNQHFLWLYRRFALCFGYLSAWLLVMTSVDMRSTTELSLPAHSSARKKGTSNRRALECAFRCHAFDRFIWNKVSLFGVSCNSISKQIRCRWVLETAGYKTGRLPNSNDQFISLTKPSIRMFKQTVKFFINACMMLILVDYALGVQISPFSPALYNPSRMFRSMSLVT